MSNQYAQGDKNPLSLSEPPHGRKGWPQREQPMSLRLLAKSQTINLESTLNCLNGRFQVSSKTIVVSQHERERERARKSPHLIYETVSGHQKPVWVTATSHMLPKAPRVIKVPQSPEPAKESKAAPKTVPFTKEQYTTVWPNLPKITINKRRRRQQRRK